MSDAFDTVISAVVALLNADEPVCPYVETDPDAEPLPVGRSASILVTLAHRTRSRSAALLVTLWTGQPRST